MLLDDAELRRLRDLVPRKVFDDAVNAVSAQRQDWHEQSLDTKLISKGFLALLYHDTYKTAETTVKECRDIPGITIESRIQSTLIKSSNALHVCSRCLKNGVADTDARDITVHNKYRRGDEPMISSMRCNRCGYTWVNTN